MSLQLQYDTKMMNIKFKHGIRVFHKWAHPCLRPPMISQDVVRQYSMDKSGILVNIEHTAPFIASSAPYWLVMIGNDFSQWREDLINFAS